MLLAAAIVLASLLASPAAAQDPQPCAPGVAPAATIRGFDIEDGGGPLTATHTIGLEAHDRDGQIRNVTFRLPPGVQARGTESDPAFSFDTAGPVPVMATWSHHVEADGSTCTASAQGTLQIRPAEELTFIGLRPGRSTSDAFQSVIWAGRNADRRPVELRLRGARRARLPGRGAPLQRLTLALREGDPGVRRARLRAAGWRFVVGYVDENRILIGASLVESCRGRRDCSRGFGFSIEVVQAKHRVGRIRVSGRCGYLGCRWRAF